MTTVKLADGTLYPIPTGPPGTWPWAREASLISVAYQQAQDFQNALKWRKEFERRALAYNSIQAGADMEAVIEAGSWLNGPAQILAYLAKTIKELTDLAVRVPRTALNLADWLPWLIVGGLVVIGIGLQKKQIGFRL